MVGTRQDTNTYGKENKNVKNANKSSKKDKDVVNMHGVKVKGVVSGGMENGHAKGFPSLNN